jgi:hypothetical protein
LSGVLRFAKDSLRFIPYALGVGWIVYVYHRHLPRIDAGTFNEFLRLRDSGCLDLVLILCLWTAAYLIGVRLVQFIGVRLEPGIERLSLASGAGFSIISLVVLLLAATHLLYRAAAWTLLALPIILGLRRLRHIPRELWPDSFQKIESDDSISRKLGHFFLLALAFAVLSVVLVSALGPAIEVDDIAYHLTSGKIYIQAHGLKAIPDNPITFLPKNIEMLFVLGMMLNSATTAKLIHFLLGFLTILATYALAQRMFSRSVGWVATGLLISSPIFLWEMRTAHIEAGLALYVFLALFGVVVWLKSQDTAWFRLAIFFLAFSQGIKYHSLLVLLSLSVVVTVFCWARRKNWAWAAKAGLKLASFSCLGLLPWAVVNLVYTGNPLFPLLDKIIPTRYWTPELTQAIMRQQKAAGIPISLDNWTEWGIPFWSMVAEQSRFRGNVGPFFLAFLPLLILRRKSQYPVGLVLSFSLLYYLMWLLTAQHVRYLVPLLPGLSVVAAFALVTFLEIERGAIFRVVAYVLACLLGLMAIFNSPFFERYGASAHYGSGILETLPLGPLLGRESKDSYLNRHIPNYPVVQFYNRLPRPKKLLLWWNTTTSLYYVDSEATWLFSPLAFKLFSEDPTQIHQLLVNDGITHIITGQRGQSVHLITRPEGQFVRNYVKRLFQNNATILYEVLPKPVEQEFISYDFLSHVSEAKVEMPNRPKGADLVTTLAIQENQRYALLTFPPAAVEFHLSLYDLPKLRFAIGQYIPQCSGRASFQVWIVASGRRDKIYERELFAEAKLEDVRWIDEEVDLAPYSGQKVRIVFQTEHLEGRDCTWCAWADPVILSQPSSDNISAVRKGS